MLQIIINQSNRPFEIVQPWDREFILVRYDDGDEYHAEISFDDGLHYSLLRGRKVA
jgi:hypothetical protein